MECSTSLDGALFLSRFVSGLKDKLRLMVKMMMPAIGKEAAKKARFQELALESIFRKHELYPNKSTEGRQQIEGASKAANHVEHESEEKLELDWPIVTKDFSKEERSNNNIGGDRC